MLKNFAFFSSLLFFAAGLFSNCQHDKSASASGETFYVKIINLTEQYGNLSMVCDPIEYLTGTAAIEAAHKAGAAIPTVNSQGDTTCSVAHDYYILNPETDTKSLEISPDATVQLVEVPKTSFGKIGVKDAKPADLLGSEQLVYPFELTVRGGKIVALRAQFVP